MALLQLLLETFCLLERALQLAFSVSKALFGLIQIFLCTSTICLARFVPSVSAHHNASCKPAALLVQC